ncbi:MAG: hypothetical protein ACLFRY_05045 [Spirochaetia bacterium]
MKVSRAVIGLFLLSAVCFAEDRSVVVEGRTIILHDDFTWEYTDEVKPRDADSIILKRNPGIRSPLVSKNGKYSLYIDQDDWIQTTGLNDHAQFQFRNKDETGYGILIFEGLPIPLENMRNILIDNASNLDPYARILEVQGCTVNNSEGELVTYTASGSGLDFTFYAYITMKEKGTIQFIFYTLSTAFEGLKPSFQEGISSLVF